MKIVTKNEGSKKQLCIITGLHGNEAFLFEPIRRFIEEADCKGIGIKLILANEEAAAKRVRFIDQDLNRSFGYQNETNKETVIARELAEIFSGDLVLDFHSHSGKETFSLISEINLNERVKQFISSLEAGKCLILSTYLVEGRSLIENCENSLSIETGQHNSEEAITFAKRCVLKAMSFLNGEIIEKNAAIFITAEKFIYNDKSFDLEVSPVIKNFVEVTAGTKIADDFFAEEDFIPALISYSVKPGKKILLVCKEKFSGGVENE